MTNSNAALAVGASSRLPSKQEKLPAASVERLCDLLRSYPLVAEEERLELVEFFRWGHPDSLAMVAYGSGLVSKVRIVKKDHPDHFRAAWRTLLPWLGFLVVILSLFVLAWIF